MYRKRFSLHISVDFLEFITSRENRDLKLPEICSVNVYTSQLRDNSRILLPRMIIKKNIAPDKNLSGTLC